MPSGHPLARRRAHRLVGAGLAATAVLALATPAGAAAPAVESFAPYVGQVSCDPTTKPGTAALAARVLRSYGIGRTGGIVRDCGRGGTSEHKEGRAWDWMLDAADPQEKAAGDRFGAWLTAKGPDGKVAYEARRLGVMYVIWNRQQWSAYRPADGWQPYRGASPHTDHVHLSLSWNGAMGRTSFWTGRVWPTDYGPCRTVVGKPAPNHVRPRLTPCPAPAPAPATSPTAAPVRARPVTVPAAAPVLPLSAYVGTTLRLGSTGPAVKALQTRLRLRADGAFGPGTRAAVIGFQGSRRLPADGVVGRSTWLALGAGAKPAPLVARPVKAPAKAAAKAPAVAGRGPLAAYVATTLRVGSSGPAVKAMQTRLRLRADGAFGPGTHAAVMGFQRSRRLPADGVVGRSTWLAMAVGYTGKPAPAKAPVRPVAKPVRPVKAPAAPARPSALLAHAGTTLKFGSTGPAVKALQSRLRLPLVGTFGPATRAAVIGFQKSRRLPADGIVGRATWAALAR